MPRCASRLLRCLRHLPTVCCGVLLGALRALQNHRVAQGHAVSIGLRLAHCAKHAVAD
ncbi:hypothetical protein XHC_1718 [Xanthomonas hortorum pv. carotae str. M081]|nr:hypothetical protein XHC_1718 [Xanthomonas hortorum pv. carotae str. M081]